MDILCRICGGTRNLKFFKDDKQLVELLELCANIIIKENDLLPKFICKQCENGLVFSYRLRKQSEATEKRLRQEIAAQTISTTTDIEDELSAYNIQQQVPTSTQNRDQRLISDVDSNICTSTNQSEKTAQTDATEQSLELTSSDNNDPKIKKGELVAPSNENCNKNVGEILDLENMPELTNEERLQLELQKRGVFMVKRMIPDSSGLLTKHTNDHEVIAGKRIQLDTVSQITPLDDELQQNSFSETLEYDGSNEDDIIELLDDDEPGQETITQGKCQFGAIHENENNDIIEEILSSGEEEEGQIRSLKERTGIVYEEFESGCNALIDVNETETQCTTTQDNNVMECTTAISSKAVREETIAKYICEICNLGFTNKYLYRRHVKIHDHKSFSCTICDKKFLRRDSLSRHLNAHKNREALQCSHCDRNFQSRFNLSRHVRAMHQNIVFMCEICGQVFTRSDVLRHHITKHTSDGDVQCEQCPKRFFSESSMRKHLISHIKESAENNLTNESTESNADTSKTSDGSSSTKKTHYCAYCGKESKSNFIHKMHLRTHTQEKPHKCEACGKAFRTLAALTAHERIHSDVRPYQCEHCLLSFRQRGHLKEHRMIHEGITPHVCSICQLGFTKKSNMLVHMRIHSGEYPYKCVICEEQFRRSEQLRKHESQVHKKCADDDRNEISAIQNDGEEFKAEDHTKCANFENVLLSSDSDSIEIIETENCPDASSLRGNAISDDIDNQNCNEVTADANRDVALESSITSNTSDDIIGIDNGVLLLVDDNATFNSLFIMDN